MRLTLQRPYDPADYLMPATRQFYTTLLESLSIKLEFYHNVAAKSYEPPEVSLEAGKWLKKAGGEASKKFTNELAFAAFALLPIPPVAIAAGVAATVIHITSAASKGTYELLREAKKQQLKSRAQKIRKFIGNRGLPRDILAYQIALAFAQRWDVHIRTLSAKDAHKLAHSCLKKLLSSMEEPQSLQGNMGECVDFLITSSSSLIEQIVSATTVIPIIQIEPPTEDDQKLLELVIEGFAIQSIKQATQWATYHDERKINPSKEQQIKDIIMGKLRPYANQLFLIANERTTVSLQLTAPSIDGLQYQPVPRDGHCLYHAVALQLGQDQFDLRQVVVTHIENDFASSRESIQQFIELQGRTLEEYLSDVREGREWGSHVEIEILMRVFGRPIVVIDPDGNIINRENTQRFHGTPIFIYYDKVSHYGAYLLKEGINPANILAQLMSQPHIDQSDQLTQLSESFHLSKRDQNKDEQKHEDCQFLNLLTIAIKENFYTKPSSRKGHVSIYNTPEKLDELGTKIGEMLPRYFSMVATMEMPVIKPEDQKDQEITSCETWHLQTDDLEFVGRTTQLADLKKAFAQNKTEVISQTIVGLGGIGKTQLALAYVHDCETAKEKPYDFIIWMDASNKKILALNFNALAERYHLRYKNYSMNRDFIAAIYKGVTTKYNNILLIFDNAVIYKDIAEYRPPQDKNIHWLITSRNRNLIDKIPTMELGKFSDKEARQYISERLTPEDGLTSEGEADRLANLLCYFPLALSQAVAYIKNESWCTIEQYIDEFTTSHEARRDFLAYQVPDDPDGQTAYTTWDITIKKIKEQNPITAEILNYCVYLNADNIPKKLLIKIIQMHGVAGEKRIDLSKRKIREALTLLTNYSLIRQTEQDVQIHNLIQTVTRLQVAEQTSHQDRSEQVGQVEDQKAQIPNEPAYIGNIIAAIIEIYPWKNFVMSDYTFVRKLMPHMVTLLSYREMLSETIEQKSLAQLLECLGYAHDSLGEYHQAKNYYDQVLTMARDIDGTILNRPDIASILHQLGDVCRFLGEYARAQDYYDQALIMEKHVYGETANHPDIAKTLHRLGNVCASLDRCDQARNYYRQAIAMVRIISDEPTNHPDIVAILLALADTCRLLKDLANAQNLIAKAHQILISHPEYEKTHPYTQQVIQMKNIIAETINNPDPSSSSTEQNHPIIIVPETSDDEAEDEERGVMEGGDAEDEESDTVSEDEDQTTTPRFIQQSLQLIDERIQNLEQELASSCLLFLPKRIKNTKITLLHQLQQEISQAIISDKPQLIELIESFRRNNPDINAGHGKSRTTAMFDGIIEELQEEDRPVEIFTI